MIDAEELDVTDIFGGKVIVHALPGSRGDDQRTDQSRTGVQPQGGRMWEELPQLDAPMDRYYGINAGEIYSPAARYEPSVSTRGPAIAQAPDPDVWVPPAAEGAALRVPRVGLSEDPPAASSNSAALKILAVVGVGGAGMALGGVNAGAALGLGTATALATDVWRKDQSMWRGAIALAAGVGTAYFGYRWFTRDHKPAAKPAQAHANNPVTFLKPAKAKKRGRKSKKNAAAAE
jgi:hypothetical protein